MNVKRVIWRWHRRVGLVVSVVVLNLCLTGVLLNHTEFFKLQDIPVHNSIILSLYGIQPPAVIAQSTDVGWVGQLDAKMLYIGDHSLGVCDGVFKGAVTLRAYGSLLIACESELLIVSSDFSIHERIGSIFQLPTPVEQLGVCGEDVCFISNDQVYLADLEKLQWSNIDRQLFSEIRVSDEIPTYHREIWLTNYQGSAINWERFFLDIHSGRIFGSLGVLIVDLSAILLIVLVVSGVWLWSKNSASKK